MRIFLLCKFVRYKNSASCLCVTELARNSPRTIGKNTRRYYSNPVESWKKWIVTFDYAQAEIIMCCNLPRLELSFAVVANELQFHEFRNGISSLPWKLLWWRFIGFVNVTQLSAATHIARSMYARIIPKRVAILNEKQLYNSYGEGKRNGITQTLSPTLIVIVRIKKGNKKKQNMIREYDRTSAFVVVFDLFCDILWNTSHEIKAIATFYS